MQAPWRNPPQNPTAPAPGHGVRQAGLHTFLRSFASWARGAGWTLLLSALLAILLATVIPLQARAAEIDILKASVDTTEDGYRLSTAYSFELNHGLETTIMRGVPLYFTTDIELTRRRWYWLDETAVEASQTTRVSYNVLTRQFHASINNSLQQNFSTLEDAMEFVRRPPRWIIADLKTLHRGEPYNVAVRMRLDVAQLSKPLQVNALNNSDWRLSSDWVNFSFKPE